MEEFDRNPPNPIIWPDPGVKTGADPPEGNVADSQSDCDPADPGGGFHAFPPEKGPKGPGRHENLGIVYALFFP